MADECGNARSSSRASNKLGKVWSHTPLELFHGAVGVLSVGTSVTGMILTGGRTMVVVAGVLSSVVGPYVYHQQTRLTDIMALKETHEAVQRGADQLREENVRLNEAVGSLTETMDALEDVERALDVITETQGQSIAAFRKQVGEHREILEDMRRNHRANMLQNLLQVVVRSDRDNSNHIGEEEVGPLIRRIRAINGCEVMEDRFRNAIISSGGSLSSVMDIIKHLMAEDDAGDDAMFILKEDNR